MKRNQIILAVLALLLVGGLFMLPKVIVSKEDTSSLTGATAAADSTSSEGHLAEQPEGQQMHGTVSPEAAAVLVSLRKQMEAASTPEQRLALADTLAGAYVAASKFDSAGYYYEQVALSKPTERNYQRAADQYYQAFSFAANQQRQQVLSLKTRTLYEEVLKQNPDNLTAKANLAMTYVASETPMKGITMLREVLEKDPNNQEALYRMGMLAIQSGQHDRAVERFRKLVEVNPNHVQGQFFLGVSLAETGKNEEAKAVFKRVKQMSDDPALQTSVDEYLDKLGS